VSSALDRIRQVARPRKKERFTSFFHNINLSLLRLAFFALKREARRLRLDSETNLGGNQLALLSCYRGANL
jgi:hypothetical protein